MHEYLKNKVMVITGGAGVLCSALALAAAKEGVKIALLGRTPEKLKAVEEKITALGAQAMSVQCDVTDKSSVVAARDAVIEKFGTVDILVNGAGGNHPKANTSNEEFSGKDSSGEITFFDLDPDNVRSVFDVNFMGTFIPSQVFGEVMAGRETTIINISSMSAYHPMTKVCAYSAAKAAVSNFTEWLSVHFAKNGIRVNAIAPGFFETEQNRTLLRTPEGTLTERAGKILRGTPMGRFGEPEELAGVFLWMCDASQSKFVTGTVIPVDGGFNAYSGV